MRRLGDNPDNLDADWLQGVPASAGDCAAHTQDTQDWFAFPHHFRHRCLPAGILFTEALTHTTKPWKLQTDRRTCVPRSPLSCTAAHCQPAHTDRQTLRLFYKFSPVGTSHKQQPYNPQDYEKYGLTDRQRAILAPPQAPTLEAASRL